ncbi:unnamed protein product [Rhizoctonia solani]|uniref:Peptidase C14 caspase domain-containing protein n=1 Tax=Rhizoctonia solani TaxID=456999 RepID=A0A8H3BTT8_9AGAM|nr:unnamed protein product [Rhizoctonia solani]
MCSTTITMTRLEIDSTPATSGSQEIGVTRPRPRAVTFSEIGTYVQQAIGDGDMLPNISSRESGQRAEKRALIIAPVYREPGQTFGPLPSDAADVKLVHEMLLRFGYKRQEIRVLCDICGGFNGRADPTRENILQSLEWLVEGTTKGDRRFLHFSGHGDRILGDSVGGKMARRVEPRMNMPGAWNVDTERSTTRIFSGRVTEQAVADDEVVYYNEGMITRVTEIRDGSMENGYADRILDSELNDYLSRLPKDCTMYYHVNHGYVSHKLLGSGFRGPHETAVAQNQARFSQNLSSATLSSTNSDTTNLPSSEGAAGGSTTPSISTAVSIMIKVVPRLMRYARAVIQEDIPDRERDLDRIEARIFAWGACHQRQESWETNDRSAGLFTQTFTETCLRMAGPDEAPNHFTYNELFNEVRSISKVVAEKRACAGLGWGNSKPAPQYVQLWTSLRNADKATQDNLLGSQVLF